LQLSVKTDVWDVVEKECRSYGGSMTHLASIVTPYEQAYLHTLLVNSETKEDAYWLGMNDAQVAKIE